MGLSIKDVNGAAISPMIKHHFYRKAKKSSKYGVEGFLYFFLPLSDNFIITHDYYGYISF